MQAFKKYMQAKYGDDIERCANDLEHMTIFDVDSSSVVWDLLDETGDEEYTRETFLKVAEKLLS